jgi:hypothetical protein
VKIIREANAGSGGSALTKMSTVNETHIEGLTTIASNFGPQETMDRLETEIRTKGMEVFARIGPFPGTLQSFWYMERGLT